MGNHDLWMEDYFQKELNIPVYRDNQEFIFGDKTFLIGHGDGKGPGDKGYKFLKKVFRNKFCQWAFARLHPNIGIGLATYFSKTSRASTGGEDSKLHDLEREWLYQFTKTSEKLKHRDFYIFGHRHLPLDISLDKNARYINLGEWLFEQTYLEITPSEIQMYQFKDGISSNYITLNNR